jgi:formylaminopyrimidine deformylase / aminopyrimidine aminohydrolase
MTPQAPDELPKPPTPSERPLTAHSLVQNAGPLWDEATRAPFLAALAAGTLAVEAFRRWLAQDYLFTKDLTAFQSILLAKIPRDCHKTLVGGLGALDKELEWFESHAGRLQVDLAIPPHRICRRYTDFLLHCVHTEAYPVLIAVLFGVEASYLAAWSALVAAGLYSEFIARWSSVDFAAYVEALGGLADRYPHEGAQKFFNEVLVHEREFWQMSWQA